ncbi:hypothetical protein, partial [Bergeyella zoohelcum]|uniref:hypothetical protein n=1 Tax=Bergeyella zoohelcum TaxID=1015 RepID=UPI002A9092A9
MQGIRNEVRLAPNGTVNKLFAGIYSNQFIASNTSFGIENELRGIFSHTDIASNANVDTNYVNIISTNTLHNNSYVKTLMDFGTYPRVQAGARVDRYIGVNISSGEIDAASEINEMMGIRITNINKGKTKNYAIHTAAGNIRFGDLRHSVSTNVASTGDRPVFVTADGVLKVGNASTALARAVWKTDGNHVKLAVKADGTDRTDNIITINDEGQMFASSFKGTNGATIFPD